MTWIDWAILLLLAGAAIGGLRQGFFRSVCSLLGLIVGIALACWNYGSVAALILPMVRISPITNAIGFLLIALATGIVFAILGLILRQTSRGVGLGCLDILGGGVIGLLQGLALVMIAILAAVAFFPNAHWLSESRLPRQFFGALHVSTHVTPQELAEKLRQGLWLLDQESPSWMHTGTNKN